MPFGSGSVGTYAYITFKRFLPLHLVEASCMQIEDCHETGRDRGRSTRSVDRSHVCPTPNMLSRACHLKMRGGRKIDRLTQGRRSMVIVMRHVS